MKYIEEISLKNFQSHKNTRISFNHGLNIIVGASDSGKTSILRGIKWVLYNEPLGDFFIREGESECSVSLKFNNGIKVERYRDKSKNQYNIYIDDEVTTYEGFGASVPLEVREIIGIDKIELDQNENRSINLAEQLDGPFLISEKPSVKASSIGRLVGANIVDDALRESLKDNRNLNIKKNSLDEENTRLKEELKTFDYLEDLEEKIQKLEGLNAAIKEKEALKSRLLGLVENYRLLRKNIELNEKILAKLKGIEKVEIRSLEIYLNNYMNLSNKFKRLKNIEEGLSLQEDILNKTETVDLGLEKLRKLELTIKRLLSLDKYSRLSRKNRLEISQLETRLEKLQGLERVRQEDMANLISKFNKLSNLNTNYRLIRSSLDSGVKYLARFELLGKTDLDSFTSKILKYERIRKLNKAYLDNQKNMEKGQEFMREKRLEVDKLILEYREILSKAEVCPFCFSNIDQEHIDEIVGKYTEEFNI